MSKAALTSEILSNRSCLEAAAILLCFSFLLSFLPVEASA